MFCPKCGAILKDSVYETEVDLSTVKNIDESTADTISENQTNDNIHGFCPECGYGIPHHLDEGELKKLNQVAHAKFHSARNKWNTGMCGIVGGSILLAIALIFFVLCFKVAENYRFSTEGEPFIVFCALSAISAFLLVFGAVYVAISSKQKKVYSSLIKSISNKTFIQ